MTQDEIIKDMIAKVYGVAWTNNAQFKDLGAFAKLVAEHEREACAKIADTAEPYMSADLIRARK